MRTVFAPGCGMKLYKPDASKKIMDYLREAGIAEDEHNICCRHEPDVANGTRIIIFVQDVISAFQNFMRELQRSLFGKS